MMQLKNNKLVIASAGSGKTTFLVDQALSNPNRKIAILTYTNNNINEIKKKFFEKNGGIPKGVDVVTWFSFLLHECARPYQRSVYSKGRVKSIKFLKGCSPYYIEYSDTEKYYFANGDEIYSDKISRFVIDCEKNSNGLVTKRLADIYDEIFIDEFQDLSGYDLEVLEVLLQADLRMTIVGDPRQYTYSTNNSRKYKQFRSIGILQKAKAWEAKNFCQIENLAWSYRSNQKICDFSDMLWPNMEKTISHNNIETGHDGIFIVPKDYVHQYVKIFSPVLLRYNKKAETYGYHALNFGNSKGLTFDRVLIIPTEPIRKYLKTADVNEVTQSLGKFYVAVTRARYSVGFIYDGKYVGGYVKWKPTAD